MHEDESNEEVNKCGTYQHGHFEDGKREGIEWADKGIEEIKGPFEHKREGIERADKGIEEIKGPFEQTIRQPF